MYTPTQIARFLRRWEAREGPRQAEVAAADAQFDGGEWSRRFHDRQWLRRLERVESYLSLMCTESMR